MKKMRKTLSLILALVLAFSLAAVPAFAADTEAESSTSDTAYGQLHNGLLSEILSQIDIANDDNFIHGIVGVNIKGRPYRQRQQFHPRHRARDGRRSVQEHRQQQ